MWFSLIRSCVVVLVCGLPLIQSRADDIALKEPGLRLVAKSGTEIELQDGEGNEIVTFGGFSFQWGPKDQVSTKVKTRHGALKRVTTPEGFQAVDVDYETDAKNEAPITVTGRFILRPGHLDVQFTLAGVPDEMEVGMGYIARKFAQDVPATGSQLIFGLWKRHSAGGIPVEMPDGRGMAYLINGRQIFQAFPDAPDIQPGRNSRTSQYIGFGPLKNGTATAGYSILVPPANWPIEAVAAQWHERPVGLHLGTDKLYNWWSDKSEALALKYDLVNTTPESREVEVAHWVRSFAGEVVSEQKRTVTLEAGQVLSDVISFKSMTDRDLFFCEVSATDKKTGVEIFSRTNLALLPPFEFKATSADSLCGIADFWQIPDAASVQKVLDRMGVRWSRHGNTHAFKNITAIRHTGLPKKGNPGECDAWIKEQLRICADEGNPWWEFGNEINYGSVNIAKGETLKDEARTKAIQRYIGFLKDVRRLQKETGLTQTKILSFGSAGMDVKFFEKFAELGGWSLIDGIALHPGRGNFTADYPVTDPWIESSRGRGNYWNFFGSVRTAKELSKKLGGNKPVWLTEVYSSGYPNDPWEDTLRNGAENTLLSLALAKSEGVSAVMWYQLFDTVWHDKLGVRRTGSNVKDREYYFGLIQRDLSFKPAFMAYCAAAEALDGATFKRWFHLEGTKTRGMLFDTPRGPMAIVWDREDGFVLTDGKIKPFPSPEPWIDRWKTQTPVTFATTGESVTVVNAIGQAQTLSASGRSVTLTLTGAPIVVYGLDPEKLD